MKKYNLFLDQKLIEEDVLFIIDQIKYFKQHKYDDDLIAKKLELEYLDYSPNIEDDTSSACGHFKLGLFGAHDIEINFALLNMQEIGFEVCLNKDKKESCEILIYSEGKLSKGKGWDEFFKLYN